MTNPYLGLLEFPRCYNPLDFSELYIGLQQGVGRCTGKSLDIFLSSKFYEQQDYVINTKHNVFVATLLMNQDTWDSLPSDLQGILNEWLC